MVQKHIIKLLVLSILALGVFFSSKGYIDQYVFSNIMAPVNASNDLYLNTSFDQALKGFLILSGIKSGLAVIEGSEVGIGFNLELGDIVQSIYDYVDIAWKAALTGATVLYFTRLILRTIELIDQIFLAALFAMGLAMMIIFWYLPKYRRIFFYLRETTLLLLVISCSLYILLPLSIKGSSYISSMVSSPLIEDAQHNFSEIDNTFSIEEMKKSLFPDEENNEGWLSKLDISRNLQQIKDRFDQLTKQLAEKSEQVAIWTIKLIVGYLFDCIIFPVFFIFTIIFFVKITFSVLLRNSQYRMMKNELES